MPLDSDPRYALSPIALPARQEPPGPMHKIEYVIEIVGPHTLTGQQARAVLQPEWMANLGQPTVWAMSPADRVWRELTTADTSATFDSLALAWEIHSPRGALSSLSARTLLKSAETFAAQVQRRAVAIPDPSEIDARAGQIGAVVESLDIGVSLIAIPKSGELSDQQVADACRKLGLEPNPAGAFELRQPEWPEPLLTVLPAGDAEGFSSGSSHPGVVLGFRVPHSPDPQAALENLFHAADSLKALLVLDLSDELEVPLTTQHRDAMRNNLRQALAAYANVGLAPGSPEARRLFV